MQTWHAAMIAVAVVVVLIGLVWANYHRQRSRQLRTYFGPEYDRTVLEFGSRRYAESVLASREARLRKLAIRRLGPSSCEKYLAGWKACQAHFVDDPARAVHEADRLVCDIMSARGFPVADVNERVE